MIGRNHSNDVFVLGEEVLDEPLAVESREEPVESVVPTPDSDIRIALGDPFRISVKPLQAQQDDDADGASRSLHGEASERPARERLALFTGGVRRGGRALRTGSRAMTPSIRQLTAAGGGIVALLAVTVVVRDSGGRPELDTHTNTISAVSAPEGRALPAVPVPVPDEPSKRDSRSRSTRGGERQGPQAAAPSSPAASAPVPSVPAAPVPSPPSQGGGPGGRETFGFEK